MKTLSSMDRLAEALVKEHGPAGEFEVAMLSVEELAEMKAALESRGCMILEANQSGYFLKVACPPPSC